MKHMKRVTSFLLAVLLTLSLCVPALALTPKADKEIVKAGEDVNVTLTIDEAMSRISSMQACVYFDGNVFTYKSFTANKEEQMTIYNTDRTSDDGRTYRTIDYVSTGKGKFAAGDEFAVFTFTAKKDINVSKQANFSAYITFRGSLKEDNTPLEEDNVTAEKTLSVTVTPASTEPEGYAVAASAVNPSITVNDKAQVELKISNKDVKTYNAYYMEVSYDAAKLTYKSVTPADATIIKDETNGTLKIAGYGADKTCGTDNIVLTFAGKATGEAKVTVTSAKVDVKGNAAAQNAPDATLLTKEATITVGGYQVTLPDSFTADSMVAEPNKDYTFTARDISKKYDFTGSTMGGNPVTVTDKGNGTYTFKMPASKVTVTATFKKAPVFTDAGENNWYTAAILWAAEKGVALDEDGSGLFRPMDNCTRADMVTFLWRVAGTPEPTVENPFTDVKESDPWYKAALWAYETGVTKGYGSHDVFAPNAVSGRAQTVLFLQRAVKGEDATGDSFTDVPAGYYYEGAVYWALQNEVTKGYGDSGVFGPEYDCNRAEIITFIYRLYNK